MKKYILLNNIFAQVIYIDYLMLEFYSPPQDEQPGCSWITKTNIRRMNFVFIDDLIKVAPEFTILKPDTKPNRIIVYQHEGELVGSNDRIGNHPENSEVVKERFRIFFSLANEKQVDLAITPEYSCPVAIVGEIIEYPKCWPGLGVLFVVGGESIAKTELEEFTKKFTSAQIRIYFEESLIKHANHFFDPVYYLFITGTENDKILHVVIQFKTMHMSARGESVIERDNLIEGKTIYVLRNSATSIWLMTLICSEAMNFEQYLQPAAVREALQWDYHPYLILNPMVNPDPTHDDFIRFRKFILTSRHKEIIELNWNNLSKIAGKPLLKYNSSRSALFIESQDIDQSNTKKIRKNHKKGLYYYFIRKGLYAFVFNSRPHIFFFQLPPVAIIEANQPQQSREGPELFSVYRFDNLVDLVEIPAVSDDHVKYLTDIGCVDPFFVEPTECVLDKERLICLTAGKIPKESPNDWYLLDKLFSVKLDQTNETNLRFTVFADTDNYSLLQRGAFVGAINKLNNIILPDSKMYPSSIGYLRSQQIRLGYPADVENQPTLYKYNVVTKTGECAKATICFLEGPLPDKVERTYEYIRKLFGIDNNNKKNVVIFYTRGEEILVKSDDTAANILDGNEYGDASIFKE